MVLYILLRYTTLLENYLQENKYYFSHIPIQKLNGEANSSSAAS